MCVFNRTYVILCALTSGVSEKGKWPRATSMWPVNFQLVICCGFRWVFTSLLAEQYYLIAWMHIFLLLLDCNLSIFSWRKILETKTKLYNAFILWSNCFRAYFCHKKRFVSETVLLGTSVKSWNSLTVTLWEWDVWHTLTLCNMYIAQVHTK